MTNEVAIVTDTIGCIPQEQVEKYGIELVPLNIVFGDKVYRDRIDINPSKFYALLRQAKKLPTTSAPSPSIFLEAYSKVSRQAANILCITLPAKLSGTFNSARLAMERAKNAFPNVVIEVLDCGTAAAAHGLVVLAAARAAASGKSLSEVVETAERVMQQVNLLAMLDSLYYLVKVGRVPKAAPLISSLIKIKPIFTVTNGDAHPVTIVRTIPNGVKHILRTMRKKMEKGQPFHVAVMHADALDRAIALRDQIASQFNCTELFITEFTPVMGAHTGPGVIGVAFYSGD